jgi:choline-sulfatase
MLEKEVASLAAVLQRCGSGSERQAARPNIVWICADDFTPDVCGTYGNRIVRTACLDRLASQAIRFDRAYCACPLSTPSRQSFWTGRYPRSIGVTLSSTPLPDDEVTLPVLLRRAGYEVAAFGKTHFYWPRRHEFDVCADWPEYEAWLSNTVPMAPSTNGLKDPRRSEDVGAAQSNTAPPGPPCPVRDASWAALPCGYRVCLPAVEETSE